MSVFPTFYLATGFLLAAMLGQARVFPDEASLKPHAGVTTTNPATSAARESLRGVYFNPRVNPDSEFPWLIYYAMYRAQIRTALEELGSQAHLNFVAVYLLIPHSLAVPKVAPAPGQPLNEWANMSYLDHVALFVDDCHEFGVSVAFDMANNMWVPYSVDTANHRVGVPDEPPGTDPYWPIADDTPWDESSTWYAEIIKYVEGKSEHPENIAWWCMGGNYSLGAAESVLWFDDHLPAIETCTEKFVKNVWPAFRVAGKRPKAAPYLLPIFSNNQYWISKTPEQRLSGFINLKKWLVDDLRLSPDYWPMTTYPFCDPAPDGFHYLRRIVEILGKENASHIVSTDFKGPGHEYEMVDCTLAAQGRSGVEILDWHFKKCVEYGFAGWWIWAYQDTTDQKSGICDIDGGWKEDLMPIINSQATGS